MFNLQIFSKLTVVWKPECIILGHLKFNTVEFYYFVLIFKIYMLYCFDCLFRAQVEDLKREILSAERDFRSQVLHLVF